jgi:hypothetical protein
MNTTTLAARDRTTGVVIASRGADAGDATAMATRSAMPVEMVPSVFQPLPERTAFELEHRNTPIVYRGLVSHWPCVQRWSLAYLADLAPDVPVKLVVGNRERHDTRFVASTLRQYLNDLQAQTKPGEEALYLKEFDLLKTLPQLRVDLPYNELFPRGSIQSVQSWVGPANARTGLHHDYLDNRAVQLVGTKRFYLVRPGVVERMDAVSEKYDAWAVLANMSVHELAAQARSTKSSSSDFFMVDLAPGDVLHVPAGWWHEVHNLTASISFGGFYGPRAAVLARWAWVNVREGLHRWGVLANGNCTCHGLC